MASTEYKDLKVLIVDDFNNFRLTLNKIMHELSFRLIDSASNGEEAASLCKKEHYDLILCDYNLGSGKNGQQLLEELRLSGRIRLEDIFILLSAETSRNIVMSAYDCEPDAYLTKPITIKVIQQRLKRLLHRRVELLDIFNAIERNNIDKAEALLKNQIEEGSRYSMDCQKILAETYLKNERFEEAEQVYRSVLEMRALNWAQVGLAQVRLAKGDSETAAEWLREIIKENPSYMRAYDVLSEALSTLNQKEKLQKNLEKAVEVSPLSLGRQIYLAETAMSNGDAEVAAKAYRKIVKHGAHSHHDTLDNQLNFARAVSRYNDVNTEESAKLAAEANRVLSTASEKFSISSDDKIQAQLLGSQLYSIQGKSSKSQDLLDKVSDTLSEDRDIDIEVELELVRTLVTLGKHKEAQKKLSHLVGTYSDNQAMLEKIDPLLPEPVSERGKKILATINKNGINAYKSEKYEKAVDYFFKASRRYPRYVGIKLNLLQAIIGKMRKQGIEEDAVQQCQSIFATVKQYVLPESNHHTRYEQLQKMLSQVQRESKG